MSNLIKPPRKILVTGGTHGIGAEICIKFAERGDHVAFLSRSKPRVDSQIEIISKLTKNFIAIQCDVLNSNSINEAWARIESEWAGVDVLINNVGGGGRWGNENILDTPLEVWQEVWQKNVGSAIEFTKLALPNMLNKGWGRVVTITSNYGNKVGGKTWFNLAKVSENLLMKNFAKNKDFVRRGITFNSLAPGAILIPDTGWDNLRISSPVEYKSFAENLPLGRLGTVEEVAEVVYFICSEEASLVNGASIQVDGGESDSL